MWQFEWIFAAVLSTLFIYIIMKYAEKLKFVDIPNERSSHKKPTPKGAGVGFSLAALITIYLCDYQVFIDNYLLFIAIFIVLITGILDDVYNYSPRFKFLTLLLAVGLMYVDGCTITTLGTYFDYDLSLYWLLVFPFTYFAVAGFTNALNLIDGIDGLAGGVSIIILLTLFTIGEVFNDSFIVVVSGSFIFALVAFMLFNWYPAKIFMGDSGSLTLGFIIAVLSIKSLAYINPTVILLIAAIPLLDTFSVIRRRRQRSLPIFKADKNHLHHILMGQNQNVPHTAQIIIMLQFAFAIIGYRSIGKDDTWNIILFIVLFQIFFLLFDPRLKKRKKHKNKKNKLNITKETK